MCTASSIKSFVADTRTLQSRPEEQGALRPRCCRTDRRESSGKSCRSCQEPQLEGSSMDCRRVAETPAPGPHPVRGNHQKKHRESQMLFCVLLLHCFVKWCSLCATFAQAYPGFTFLSGKDKEKEWARFATSTKKGCRRAFGRRDKVPLRDWADMCTHASHGLQGVCYLCIFHVVPASLCSHVSRLKSSPATTSHTTCALWRRLFTERSTTTLLVSGPL